MENGFFFSSSSIQRRSGRKLHIDFLQHCWSGKGFHVLISPCVVWGPYTLCRLMFLEFWLNRPNCFWWAMIWRGHGPAAVENYYLGWFAFKISDLSVSDRYVLSILCLLMRFRGKYYINIYIYFNYLHLFKNYFRIKLVKLLCHCHFVYFKMWFFSSQKLTCNWNELITSHLYLFNNKYTVLNKLIIINYTNYTHLKINCTTNFLCQYIKNWLRAYIYMTAMY